MTSYIAVTEEGRMLAGQKLVRRPARMVRMSLKVRMEYQKVLRERYWKVGGRREKS